MAGPESDTPGLARSELVRVLESAARLQEVLPDAVLVGGSPSRPTLAPSASLAGTRAWTHAGRTGET